MAGKRDAVLEAEQVIKFAVAGAVVRAAADLMDLLVQRASHGDVEFLDAAADRQQRHAAAERLAGERQGGAVAEAVVLAGGERRVVAVERRVDVAGAAGEKEAVEAVEHAEHDLADRGE